MMLGALLWKLSPPNAAELNRHHITDLVSTTAIVASFLFL